MKEGGEGIQSGGNSLLYGAKTRFVGRIGGDRYGVDALAMYNQYGISTEMIKVDLGIHTGISAILVNKEGQNSICVVSGANYRLSEEDIDDAMKVIGDSWLVGFQLENTFETVSYAIRKVHHMGVKVLLDPAPARKLPEELYPYIDYIKPNEHEATILTGIAVTDGDSAIRAGKWFIHQGTHTAIITLGAQGAILVTPDKEEYFPAPRVKAIDTTGAGDCFSGVLMATLSKGSTVEEAIHFANCAAAISVTRLGVIESIPKLSEVITFMNKKA